MLRSSLLLLASLVMTILKPGDCGLHCLHACETEWCVAAQNRNESIIREAIEEGDRFDVCHCACEPFDKRKRLFHVTACSGAAAVADLMISTQYRCYVGINDIDGNTSMHDAAGCCNAPMAYVFLSAGDGFEGWHSPYPDRTNNDGMSPLCVAAMQDDTKCSGVAQHLVDFGADICQKCPVATGQLPYDIAVNQNVKDTIAQNGGRPAPDGTC